MRYEKMVGADSLVVKAFRGDHLSGPISPAGKVVGSNPAPDEKQFTTTRAASAAESGIM